MYRKGKKDTYTAGRNKYRDIQNIQKEMYIEMYRKRFISRCTERDIYKDIQTEIYILIYRKGYVTESACQKCVIIQTGYLGQKEIHIERYRV